SDFLVHDMGSLGDMIGNEGDTVAKTRLMRTAPLWGLRFRTKFLHDGRATSITAAIQAHAGQGKAAADAFNALSSTDKATLLQGLSAL
ncbi:MAG TPA: di-heme oxidoredictase family protein, partial [Kofleriaceae bacterium]|nr:di-heme oxidoredictase family protein [Kofleriaceae bacterium]